MTRRVFRRSVTGNIAAAARGVMLLSVLSIAGSSSGQGNKATAKHLAPKVTILATDIGVSSPGSENWECHIAANPTDPNNLVAASMRGDEAHEGEPGRVFIYTSHNGGKSWSEQEMTSTTHAIIADPQVSFDSQGEVYVAALAQNNKVKNARAEVGVTRSGDGGDNWDPSIMLPLRNNEGYDHEMIVTDQIRSPHASRLYISVLVDRPGEDRTIGLIRSQDHAKTFSGPSYLPRTEREVPGHRFNTANGIGVFQDGSLAVPIFEMFDEDDGPRKTRWLHSWLSTSNDEGASLSEPIPINKHEVPIPDDGISIPSIAVDAKSSKFTGNAYIVWDEFQNGGIWLASSSDRGKSWSNPRNIDSMPQAVRQLQPAIAVNSSGILGVTWYRARTLNGKRTYDVYFSASADGGDTFSDAVRVSSKSSGPIKSFFGVGDYMGLCVDTRGVFHALWVDHSGGSSVIRAAQIAVSN